MKMNQMKTWAVAGAVLATSLFAASDASATTFKVMGAGNLLSNHLEPTPAAGFTITSAKGKFAFGGGASMVFGGPAFGVEVGGSYLTSEGTVTLAGGSSGDASIKYSYLQIPLLMRLNLGRVISVGVGGYYNKHLGKVTTTDVNGTTESSFDTASTGTGVAMKGSSYGLLGSLGFDIPLGASTGLVIDGRYAYGLAEVSMDTAQYAWKPVDIQAYVGLRFGGSK